MKIFYDLHIHSALSPCGDNDMTPNNIVNMAMLNELDMIAVTDHNSCKNCAAAVEIGQAVGITVVPGMELTTSEDIHVVCYFPDINAAKAFDEKVSETLLPVPNEPDIFGHQYIMDKEDEIIDELETLLIGSCDISIMGVVALVKSFGGACIPAHVNRESYSIISVLGEIVPECNFKFIEVSKSGNPSDYDYPSFSSSDAHYLENISERINSIELPENSAKALIDYINGRC